jgi:presenilin-like A22 family membrane protease
MNKTIKVIDVLPIFLMAGLFVLIDCLALTVAGPFKATGEFVFENPGDPLNLVYFFLTFFLSTAAILLISKFWKKQFVQVIVLGATGLLIFYVFYPLMAIVLAQTWSLGLSVTATAFLVIMLVKYPEWYVVDVSGILIGVGAIAMLGISLKIHLVIILLTCLSVYDAISVYKTKHMIDLADTIVDLRLPSIFVIPKRRRYSLVRETKGLKEKLREGEERDAFFMGVGDVVVPGILAVSIFHNLASNGLLIALSVIIGTLLGFTLLMTYVLRGKPQAGLPYLCIGAILGYLVSSYLVFGGIAGLTLFI